MTNENNYKLDWETIDVKLAKGRFAHTMRRPSADLLIERDKELATETPIGRDGSFSLPDPTANEAVEAKYFDLLIEKSTGYEGQDVPQRHKAAVMQGMYQRSVAIDEDADVFDDEITVIEEIGGADDPDFSIRHVFRSPSEDELQKIRRKMNAGELKPDKRGRQKFIAKSNLKTAMDFYRLLVLRVEGVTIGGETFTDELRGAFIDHVDPLVQREAVRELVQFVAGGLLD